jgi:hypothetical protein
MSTIEAYSYQIKAYESNGDLIHGDYIFLNQIYIPTENLQYHFHNNFIVISNPQRENNLAYLKSHNINNNDKNAYYNDVGSDVVYDLNKVQLEKDFVTKLKQYNEIDKQKKNI